MANMNPRASTPNMQPAGSDCPDLYVVGDYPNYAEDEMGKPWQDRESAAFRRAFHGMDVRWDHACRTLPKDDKPPTPEQFLAFSREVLEDIEEAKPKCIVAAGDFAFQLLQPALGKNMKRNMLVHRGRQFPVRVGSHTCWLVPTFDKFTRTNLLTRGAKGMCKDPKQWRRVIDDDFALARTLARGKGRKPLVYPHDAKTLLREAGTKLCTTEADVLAALERVLELAEKGKLLALDYECRGLRPYQHNAAVLTMALTIEEGTWAMLVEHPAIRWTRKGWARFLKLYKKVLKKHHVICHGLEFECEWTMHLLGREAARVAGQWECTLVQAFIIANRGSKERGGGGDDASESMVSGLSLDYLARLHFGLPLKKLSGKELWNELGDPTELLEYNALDTILTYDVYLEQEAHVNEEGLDSIYRRHIRRIPTAIITQWDGTPTSQAATEGLRKEYESKAAEAEAEFRKLPEVDEFKRIHRRAPSISSNDDVKELFKILGHDLPNTTAATLQELYDVEYLTRYVLAHRAATKLVSTYVEPFDRKGKKCQIFPDDRIHPRYHTARVDTGRVSASEPNVTNQPERGEGKRVKQQYEAPPGWMWTAFDYGQIEARVLGMAARDKVFCKMLWDRYDVHEDWAEKVARLFPNVLKRHDGDIKKLRGSIKNKLVFPWFFGAGLASVARNLMVSEELLAELYDEFWGTFAASKKWQQKLKARFDRTNYTETLTGRRRYGPMTFNAIINMPIQGTAADIVFNSWDRISERAMREKIQWLQPNMMVHDDLKFLHPISEASTIMRVVPKMMLDVPFSFVNVPITIEASRGTRLSEMEDFAEFSSDEMEAA